MAKLYGEIAAKALLTLDKSFARANGQPLDASEVYYSLAAAKTYAATAQAYIGQKIVVIENGVVTHYSVEDTAGNLKELGSKPVADGTTVAIGADGKITLANITEAEASGTYNAVLVNGVLTWVKPSETTVEGLSDLIQALTGRVDTAEADIDALQAAVGVAAKDAVGEEGSEGYEPAVVATGLHKAIADEVARATAAEKALGERIDGIDFIDEDELTEALDPYATKTYVGEEIAKVEVPVVGIATDDKVLSIADKVISATVAMSYDDVAKAIKLTGKDGVELGSVDATPFIKDGMLHDVEYDADSNTLTFTWNTDAGESKTDTVVLSDIIEPYTAGNGLELSGNEFAIKLADGSESFLTVSADGLKLAGVQTAINTAKDEAVAAAATAAAGLYATKTALGDLETALDTRLDALEAYDHSTYATKEEVNNYKTEVSNTYATAETLNSYKTEVSTTYATKVELEPVAQDAANAKTAVGNLETRFDEIVAVGGEPNAINKIQVNGSELTITDKTVNIAVPTKFTDLTDDSGFSDRIDAAKTQADKGVSDASAAAAAASAAQGEVDALEIEVGGIQTTVAGHTTTITDHGTRIGALEQADIAHATEYNELKGIVTGHTASIATKAEQTALDSAVADIAKNTAAIATLNDTTIVNINAEIAKKANADNVYTKTEVGTIAEGKTLVEMINEAKSEATYDDTAIKADIKKNTDAIAVLNGDAETEGSVLKIAKAEAETAAKAKVEELVGAAPEALDTLEEIAKWIAEDETGTTALVDRVAANEAAITAINNADSGILAQAKKYTDDSIGALPAATAEALGLVKVDDVTIKADAGVISVKAISTDLLVQGTSELVLNGGSAV